MYNDIARDEYYLSREKEYSDLADTTLLIEEPELFWKFWGDCTESYRRTESHNGYHILNKWCAILPQLARSCQDAPRSTHVYTSNVDGHFRRFNMLQAVLTEIHGCAEESVCSSSIGYFATRNIPDDVKNPPENSTFKVDIHERIGDAIAKWNRLASEEERLKCRNEIFYTPSRPYLSSEGIYTATAPFRKSESETSVSEQHRGVPMCSVCGKYPLRPHVVMFGDSCPNVMPRIWECTDAYQRWENAMEEDLLGHVETGRMHTKKLVILELGCGLRVPSVRREVEEVLMDVNQSVGTGELFLLL